MKKLPCILIILSVFLSSVGIVPKTAATRNLLFSAGTPDELEKAKQISLDILRGQAASRAIGSVDDYKIERVQIDELRIAHTHVRQTINDIPVWEGEAIVHLKPDGSLFVITDELKENIVVNTEAYFTADDAIFAAKRYYGPGARFLTKRPEADMWILRSEDRDHLVYRVRMARIDGSPETSAPVMFIDAQTGEKVLEYDDLQTFETVAAHSLYSDTVTVTMSKLLGTYYLEDLGRKMGTFTMNSTGDENSATGGTTTRITTGTGNWGTAPRVEIDAHYGAEQTFEYYKNVHSRNGIDGNYGPVMTSGGANSSIGLLTSRVHFGSSGHYNNAFWNENMMSYGDGDGVQFSPLATVDICGHEMTHGVTAYTAKLTYRGESGALNESWSDVMGAMVERYADNETDLNTWKIGEDAFTPATPDDALRYLDNPHKAVRSFAYTIDDDPDHYAERYTGYADNGGVHVNSGIANKAFYLAAAGGTHHRSGITVEGIGINEAERVWYYALAHYMTSGTRFDGARAATLDAAKALFGETSPNLYRVGAAWCAVGVGDCPELLVNGGFEGTLTPWVGSDRAYFYTSGGTFPFRGRGYIYFGVKDNATGQVYQTVTIPPMAPARLSFWLNVTSGERTTSTAYDKLFVEVLDTSGNLLGTLATYSNLHNGPPFIYFQKSLNMVPYRGKTVRLQFRVVTDASKITTFRIDAASLK